MFFELLIAALAIFICLFIHFHEWPSLRTMEMMRKFPGPPEIVFFGHGWDLAKVKYEDMLNFFGNWCKEYGPIFKMWRLGIPSVVLTEPEDIEVVLCSTQYIKKGLAYERLKDWLHEGLLLSTGSKWKSRRKLLTPAFHFKILENCIETFYKDSLLLIDELLKINEKPIDIDSYVSKFTLQVICETAMGIQLNNLPDNGGKYREAIQKINQIVVRRIMSPLYLRDWFFHLSPLGREQATVIKTLHSFTDMVIEERRQLLKSRKKADCENENRKKIRATFLDCLLELSENEAGLFSLNDIREEVDTFMFEGHDTTAAAISATIFMIGHHPEVQKQIIEELDKIFGKSEREITINDLHNLKYLECVIKESLRLFPSVPVIIRRLESDISIQKGKYIIPATCSIVIFPYWLHRNPHIFPQPEKFIPERFLSEESIARHPFSYIPFSGGPRNCIGQRFALMEMKIVLTTILRKATVHSITKIEDTKMGGGLILRPHQPFRVKVIPRIN